MTGGGIPSGVYNLIESGDAKSKVYKFETVWCLRGLYIIISE
jgi:hypothetical protein